MQTKVKEESERREEGKRHLYRIEIDIETPLYLSHENTDKETYLVYVAIYRYRAAGDTRVIEIERVCEGETADKVEDVIEELISKAYRKVRRDGETYYIISVAALKEGVKKIRRAFKEEEEKRKAERKRLLQRIYSMGLIGAAKKIEELEKKVEDLEKTIKIYEEIEARLYSQKIAHHGIWLMREIKDKVLGAMILKALFEQTLGWWDNYFTDDMLFQLLKEAGVDEKVSRLIIGGLKSAWIEEKEEIYFGSEKYNLRGAYHVLRDFILQEYGIDLDEIESDLSSQVYKYKGRSEYIVLVN